MFDAYHFHIETTFDTTDAVVKTFFIILIKKDIYSPRLVVTLLRVFPNFFPCVYLPVTGNTSQRVAALKTGNRRVQNQ